MKEQEDSKQQNQKINFKENEELLKVAKKIIKKYKEAFKKLAK
jgi:hypothetical protein